ncbi:hypothetical protein GCM10027347_57240 [Larkinella harenae]
MSMYFRLEQHPNEQNRYQVRLMDDTKIIMISEVFSSKVDALTCIRRVKRAALHVDNFVIWDIDSHRFNLYYGDGQLIGAVKYKMAQERDEALMLIRLAIVDADVHDHTKEFQQAA